MGAGARIAVTGGSGVLGRHVIADLAAHGYAPFNLDVTPPLGETSEYRPVDLVDYGEVFAALAGAEFVVHAAANPDPDVDHLSGADRFHNNMLSTFNVLNAAVELGVARVVVASSETVLGYPFDRVSPDYFPVDEEHRLLPQNRYAMAKVLGEDLARLMHERFGTTFVSLRFSNIHVDDDVHIARYEMIPGYWSDPMSRKFNLWGYIDARDAAQSVRLGLEAEIDGADEFIIAAADTIMDQPSRRLVEAAFPDTPVADDLGEYETLLSIAKARRILGFEPEHSWRTALGGRS